MEVNLILLSAKYTQNIHRRPFADNGNSIAPVEYLVYFVDKLLWVNLIMGNDN